VQEEMWQPHTNKSFTVVPDPPYKTHLNAYGLGWDIHDRNGYVTLSHTGGMPGMLSSTLLIPELDAAVVVLTNTYLGGLAYWTLRQSIMDMLIGVDGKDWISEAQNWVATNQAESDSVLTAVWDIAMNTSPEDVEMENYTGTYRDDWFGRVEILKKDGQLYLESERTPLLGGKMFYYQATTFVVKMNYNDMSSDAFAIFSLDENGKATGFTMKGIDPHIDFSFDYQDLEFERSK
jgi:hypothetical protein